jgi:hypothetical protein
MKFDGLKKPYSVYPEERKQEEKSVARFFDNLLDRMYRDKFGDTEKDLLDEAECMTV